MLTDLRRLSRLLCGIFVLALGLAGCRDQSHTPGSATRHVDARAVTLEPVASGLQQPIFVTHAGDDRLMIVERIGRIRIVRDGALLEEPFVDITTLVSVDSERGLLSAAFHPDYSTPTAAGNGLLWVNYTDTMGRTVIARYRVMADDPDRVDPTSARILLTIDQPFGNHNGGQIHFGVEEGPEQQRYLYIAMGDGGGSGDRSNFAQSDDTVLGKLLRLDPSTDAEPAPPFYAVPADNPHLGAPPPLDTIWAKGLRNPFRFSFDSGTGDMYIADVGQNRFEEVHLTPVGAPSGVNYGWRRMEGLECFDPSESCDQSGLDLPIITYSHDDADRCAIIGGYVYRGMRFPGLFGTYLYADFCSQELFGMDEVSPDERVNTVLLTHSSVPMSFGEDVNGEVYLADLDGNVWRVAAE
jgi:glucose/arabinose dehydrogenase